MTHATNRHEREGLLCRCRHRRSISSSLSSSRLSSSSSSFLTSLTQFYVIANWEPFLLFLPIHERFFYSTHHHYGLSTRLCLSVHSFISPLLRCVHASQQYTEFREHTIYGQKYKPVPGDDSYCIKVFLSMCRSHLYMVLPAS